MDTAPRAPGQPARDGPPADPSGAGRLCADLPAADALTTDRPPADRADSPGADHPTDDHQPADHATDHQPADRRKGQRARRRTARVLRLLALPVVLAAFGLATVASVSSTSVAVGEQAPGFSLPRLSPAPAPGQRIALSNYAGQPLIINFCASWSPPCAAQTALLAHFYSVRHGQVVIIGVDARDGRDAALALLRQSLVTYPVAADPTLALAGRYGVPGIPSTYFLNAQHQIVQANFGFASRNQLVAGVLAMGGG